MNNLPASIVSFIIKVVFLWPEILTTGIALAAVYTFITGNTIWILLAILAVAGIIFIARK